MNASQETEPTGLTQNAELPPTALQNFKRKMQFALLLLTVSALMLLVAGCATPPQPCEPAMAIPQPALQMQKPSQSYLTTANQRMQTWQDRLKAGTSKP